MNDYKWIFLFLMKFFIIYNEVWIFLDISNKYVKKNYIYYHIDT